MLWISFTNDGSGDELIGNYEYKVVFNDRIIE